MFKRIFKRLVFFTIMYFAGIQVALGIVTIMQKQGVTSISLIKYTIIMYISVTIMEALFVFIEEKGKDDYNG